MIFNLSAKDTLELTKAVKSGKLNTDKVECLKPLALNYTPRQKFGSYSILMFKKLIDAGLGLVPTSYKEWRKLASNELVEKIKERFGDEETFYNKCIKEIFDGVTSMYALGMHQSKQKGVPSRKKALEVYEDYLEHVNDAIHCVIVDDWKEYE